MEKSYLRVDECRIYRKSQTRPKSAPVFFRAFPDHFHDRFDGNGDYYYDA